MCLWQQVGPSNPFHGYQPLPLVPFMQYFLVFHSPTCRWPPLSITLCLSFNIARTTAHTRLVRRFPRKQGYSKSHLRRTSLGPPSSMGPTLRPRWKADCRKTRSLFIQSTLPLSRVFSPVRPQVIRPSHPHPRLRRGLVPFQSHPLLLDLDN